MCITVHYFHDDDDDNDTLLRENQAYISGGTSPSEIPDTVNGKLGLNRIKKVQILPTDVFFNLEIVYNNYKCCESDATA